jgi:hypothetical protein
MFVLAAWWVAEFAAGAPPPPPAAPESMGSGIEPAADRGVDQDHVAEDAALTTSPQRILVGSPATPRTVAVFGEQLEPVQGATVRYLPPAAAAALPMVHNRFATEDCEQLLHELGASAVSDARGVVTALVEPGTKVCARLGDHYGEAFWPADVPASAPLSIHLQRDHVLRVEVVDEAGTPVPGLHVAIEARTLSRLAGKQRDFALTGPTDASGQASVPHLQERLLLPGPDVLSYALRLSFELPQLETAARSITAEELFAVQPIRLVVPLGGDVELRLVDADGLPYRRAPPRLNDVADEAFCQASSPSPGIWRYTAVPLGKTWRVRTGGALASVSAEFAGPQQARECVRVELRIPRRTVRLRGRLLQDGAPLAEVGVKLESEHGFAPEPSPGPGGDQIVSDGSGRFAIRVSVPIDAPARELTLSVQHPCLAKDTEVRIGAPTGAADIDLGDLVLPPFAAAEPLLVVRAIDGSEDRSHSVSVQVMARRQGQRYSAVPLQQRRTARGLELWGLRPPGELRIWVNHPECCSHSQVVREGEHVTVSLQRCGALWATVLLPPAPSDAIQLGVESLDVEPPSWTRADVERRGQWCWSRLPPGRYRIVARIDGGPEQRSEPFVVQVGANRWPVDGGPCDWRHLGRFVHIEVVDAANGARVTDPSLMRVVRGPAPDGGGERIESAQAWWLARVDGPELVATAPGYVPVRLPAPMVDSMVSLRAMTRLRLFPSPSGGSTRLSIVHHAVADPLLRSFDQQLHESPQVFDGVESRELLFAAGTELEIVSVVDGRDGPAQRVLVVAAEQQEVRLP